MKSKTQNPRAAAASDLLVWLDNNRITYRQPISFQKAADYSLYRYLVSNVIRHKSKYDFFIGELTGRDIQKLDMEVVICLMLGLVQLEQEFRVNNYAAVNETVELIAIMGKPFLKGFINANLRAFLRERDGLLQALEQQILEIRTSHQNWMIKRWRKQFGTKMADRICEVNNILPKVQIIVNSRFDKIKIMADLAALDFEISANHSEGLTIRNPSGLFDTKWAKLGAFLMQDRSSQMVNKLIKFLPKKSVLDACASPGGKLFHLEWQHGSQIQELIAADISRGRLKRLKTNLNRFQSKARLVQMDAAKSALKTMFDLVLVDAPCSSTGTIQKHPELKWDRREVDFLSNQKKQLGLLEGLKRNVKPGGYMLYTTCSLESEENQQVVQKFLEKNSSLFRWIPFCTELIDRKHLTTEGYYQCLPDQEQMGMFSALLQRA